MTRHLPHSGTLQLYFIAQSSLRIQTGFIQRNSVFTELTTNPKRLKGQIAAVFTIVHIAFFPQKLAAFFLTNTTVQSVLRQGFTLDCLWKQLPKWCSIILNINFSNIYAVQQDTQSVSMSEFYSALKLARHVSELIGPSSGAFCTSCILRFGMWYSCAYYSTRPVVT